MSTLSGSSIYGAVSREPVHPFPARMSPDIALASIPSFSKPLRILDPMMGSGTVLAIARAKGHHAIGVDVDPLAFLISKVWTTSLDCDELRRRATRVIECAKKIFSAMTQAEAYPLNADEETKRFTRFWFDSYSRLQLASLARAIRLVRDDVMRDALWCSFSRLIITKQSGSSLAMDLSHSRPHKSFDTAPSKPFRKFLSAADRVAANCIDSRTKSRGPQPRIHLADARRLPLPDATVDFVLTSPPYLNAIDYIRCSKFSLIWMGYSIGQLRNLRKESIGAESGAAGLLENLELNRIIADLKPRMSLTQNLRNMLARYAHDIWCCVREVERVLSPMGSAVFVIGDNTIKGTFVRNSAILAIVGDLSGLKLVNKHSRTLPANRRYLPPPARASKSLDARMRREVIIEFRKPSTAEAIAAGLRTSRPRGF